MQWAGTMVIQLVILALMLRLEKPAPLSVILTWNKEERYAVWRPLAQFGDRSLDALPEDRPDLSPEQRRLLLSEVHVPRLFAWSRYPAALCTAFERAGLKISLTTFRTVMSIHCEAASGLLPQFSAK